MELVWYIPIYRFSWINIRPFALIVQEPYKPAAHLRLLDKLPQHPRQYAGYLDLPGPLPFIKPGVPLRIRDEAFAVGDMIGEGGFAKVRN